jgi:endo-1,4-beta-xylanase
MYIKTVLKHILESPYKETLYAIDVLNEYFHSWGKSDSPDTGKGVAFFEDIYPIREATGQSMVTNPEFAKKAYMICYEMLEQYNMTEKTKLFYNDFSTYNGDIADRIIKFHNYLNSKDSINPEGKKICEGVGMQTHLGYNNPTLALYEETVNKFVDAGLKIHVTEWDVMHNRQNGIATPEECGKYYKDIMSILVNANAGKPEPVVTSITIWGLYDGVSWRAEWNPLIFTGLYNPKPAYYDLMDLVKPTN